jgi:iron complex transport system ATP-binding protein
MSLPWRLQNLSAGYAPSALVEGLNIELHTGECWVLLGVNGAGKSTLLNTISGWYMPITGLIEGSNGNIPTEVLKLSPLQLSHERAMLTQQQRLGFSIDVLAYVMQAVREPAQQASEHAMHWLRRLDAQHLAQRDVRALSGGERQRVQLARVLARQTPLVLLDEPLSHLDLAHQRMLAGLLQAERASRCFVIAVHDINWAQAVATHALLLCGNGRWQAGRAEEVMTSDAMQQLYGIPLQSVVTPQGLRWVI